MNRALRENRRPSDLSARVLTPSGSVHGRGRVKNLSSAGLLLEHGLPFPPGASIGVELPASAERGRIAILGEVRWTAQGGVGIQVTAMVPHHRVRYQHLLAALDHPPPPLPASLGSAEGSAEGPAEDGLAA